MKQKFYLVFAGLFLFILQLKAQAPEAFHYQGVARNGSGSILSNQIISLRFTIHQVSAGGTSVYQETWVDTTNQFGLFSDAIGRGTVVSGNFSTIAWGSDSYYLQVEMDTSGGTSFVDMGVTQFLSVPYALYAQTSGGSNTITGINPIVVTGPASAPVVNIQGSNKGGVLYSTGAGTAALFTAQGVTGQVLQSNGNAAPSWVSPSSIASAWELIGNDVTYIPTPTPGTYLGTNASGGAGFQFGIGGVNAGRVESSGKNTALGYKTLNSNSTGTGNAALGYNALLSNTSGNYNTAIGVATMYNNASGSENTAIGYDAAYSNTGNFNLAIGYGALFNNTASDYNVAIGDSSLYKNTGSGNTAIGHLVGLTNTSGSNNTLIGARADLSAGNLTNATAIGANAIVAASNALVLGNGANVGIGTSSPNSSLQISNGTLSLAIMVSASSVNLSSSPNTYTVIITATGQTVTLPAASSCTGRVYVIVAQFLSGSITTSSYKNFNGTGTTSLSAGNSVVIQSDGTNWDQIMSN